MTTSLRQPPQGILYNTGTEILPMSFTGTGISASTSNGAISFTTVSGSPVGSTSWTLTTDIPVTAWQAGISTGIYPVAYSAATPVASFSYDIPLATAPILLRMYMSTVLPIASANWTGVQMYLYDSNAPTAQPIAVIPLMQFNGTITGNNILCKKLTNVINPPGGGFPSSVTLYVAATSAGGSNGVGLEPILLSSSSTYLSGKCPCRMLLQQVS